MQAKPQSGDKQKTAQTRAQDNLSHISSPDFPSVTLILRRAEQDLACFRIVLSGRRGLDVCEHLQRSLHGWARVDSVEPLLDLGELRPVDSVSLARAKPRKNRDIGDGILRAGEVRRLR